MKIRICEQCGESLPVAMFSWYDNIQGYRKECKPCAGVKRMENKNKEKVYKLISCVYKGTIVQVGAILASTPDVFYVKNTRTNALRDLGTSVSPILEDLKVVTLEYGEQSLIRRKKGKMIMEHRPILNIKGNPDYQITQHIKYLGSSPLLKGAAYVDS